MFCHITENWRDRPLVSREVVVNLIGHTATRSGLAIHSELDANSYPTGQPVTAEQMDSLSLKRDKFHGDWNYSLTPRGINKRSSYCGDSPYRRFNAAAARLVSALCRHGAPPLTQCLRLGRRLDLFAAAVRAASRGPVNRKLRLSGATLARKQL